MDFTLAANGATSATISSGSTAVYPLLLDSALNTPGTATLGCTGAPVNATCVVTPANAPLGSATTISVTLDTGVTVAALDPNENGKLVWWGLALPLLLPFRRRRRCVRLLFLCTGLLGLAACGSGRLVPPGGGGGGGGSPVTPSGTYSVIASATSAGLTRSVTLTLVVK